VAIIFFEKLERERERERKKSFPGNSLEVSSWAVDSYGSIAGGSERASSLSQCNGDARGKTWLHRISRAVEEVCLRAGVCGEGRGGREGEIAKTWWIDAHDGVVCCFLLLEAAVAVRR
jgi:hypothetical protein